MQKMIWYFLYQKLQNSKDHPLANKLPRQTKVNLLENLLDFQSLVQIHQCQHGNHSRLFEKTIHLLHRRDHFRRQINLIAQLIVHPRKPTYFFIKIIILNIHIYDTFFYNRKAKHISSTPATRLGPVNQNQLNQLDYSEFISDISRISTSSQASAFGTSKAYRWLS